MRCILMNKNVPVVELELDDDTATILKVIKSYELDFLPIGVDVKAGIPNKKELNEWWFGRSIPASRSGLASALEQLGVRYSEQLLFRKWANGIVKDYTIKGWVMDDERLKNGGSVLTEEYFDRLLEQIREIRLSERRFYQKITDIYATALDYDRNAKTTKQFFAKVQNKMHYAVHGVIS